MKERRRVIKKREINCKLKKTSVCTMLQTESGIEDPERKRKEKGEEEAEEVSVKEARKGIEIKKPIRSSHRLLRSLSGADLSFVTARARGSTTRTLRTSRARR